MLFRIFDEIKKQRFKKVLISLSISLLSFITTLINPYGVRVYLELIRHLKAPLNIMIAEWVTPHQYHQVSILVGITLVFMIHAGTKTHISPFTVLAIVFGFFSLSARRNLPLFYFSVVLWLNKVKIIHTHINLVNERSQKILLVYVFLFLVMLNILRITSTVSVYTPTDTYCSLSSLKYPCKAIKHIPHKTKNLYTAYEWGGYLIWQKPEIKVFVDGRMSAWKDEKTNRYAYQTYLYIIQAQKGWNEMLSQYKTDTLLIMPETFLDLELQRNAHKFGWKEVYRDEVGVIYIKS